MKVHQRIHEIRSAKKLSQDEFAARLGISRSHVSKIEAGKEDASDQLLTAICREFGVKEEWLRDARGTMYLSTSDLLNAIKERGDEQVKLEVGLLQAKAQHYDELMDLIFRRQGIVSEGIVSEGRVTYQSREADDPRCRRLNEIIARIVRGGNEHTIAAIEFILRQSDPGEKGGGDGNTT